MDEHEFTRMLSAAQRGDPAAASALFRAYQPRLLRYLRAREPRVAEDLAGEVWLVVARSLADFHGTEAGFRGWIFTITRRRVSEHRRRGVRRQTDPVDPESLADHPDRERTRASSVSARNRLTGIVTRVVKDTVMAQVEMVCGPHRMVSLMSAEAAIPLQAMRKGTLDQRDWTTIASTRGRINEAPLYIDDSPNMTMPEIRSKARRIKKQHGLDFIVLDYLDRHCREGA